MAHPVKIATCCYCGTRAALVFDRVRHELVCSSCGAPLHVLKMMPQQAKPAPKPSPLRAVHPGKKVKKQKSETRSCSDKRTRRTHRARRRWDWDMFEDVWDKIEDIFD